MTNDLDSFLNSLPSVTDIQDRINRRFDDTYRTDPKTGARNPYVCTICDHLLTGLDDVTILPQTLLKKAKTQALLRWDTIPSGERIRDLEEYYTFQDTTYDIGDRLWLKELCLSPRGLLLRKSSHGNSRPGFSSCKTCLQRLTAGKLPFYAIINKNYVGGAPSCLTDLTELEIALLTPVVDRGYCFSYTGGTQRNMRGNMTFMRIKEERIAAAVAQMKQTGLTKHILVILSGQMTSTQKMLALTKSKIRTEKVITALEWLCENHKNWKHIHLDTIVQELMLRQVVVIDGSEEVECQNTNVEQEELFTCYYPDGAMNPREGGCSDGATFQQYVEDMAKKGYNLEFELKLQEKFIKGTDDETLVKSSLLQFPYGICANREQRIMESGKTAQDCELTEYLDHLSRVSNPVFQTNFFQLVMYSIMSKCRILKSSRLDLRTAKDAKDLAEGLDSKDIQRTVEGRKSGNYHAGTNVSRKLLSSVDACSRALPHTREAAKKGRSTAEAMQHYFGTGAIFLTVSFDDENGLLMQVLTREEIDGGFDLSQLTEEELETRKKQRRLLRLRYPGMAAHHFEILLEILLVEVVGWNRKDGCATPNPGMYGICQALSMAIEEQGRKTLHVHMTIWIKGFEEVRKEVFFGTDRKKEAAKGILHKYYDLVASTHLFPTVTEKIQKAFDHDCNVITKRHRNVPVVISDQELRCLRHRYGYKDSKGVFATCPDCTKTWTYEDLLADMLSNQCNYIQPAPAPDSETITTSEENRKRKRPMQKIVRNRLCAEVVNYQKSDSKTTTAPVEAINGFYQPHLSCHTEGCFRCAKKMNHRCGPHCECRYRLPDRKRPRTTLRIEEESAKWCCWTGEVKEQPLAMILPKRNSYDLFQNVSCPAISVSKFACNNNISVIMDGPVAQYMFKYHVKDTQKDDTSDYKSVVQAIKRVNGRVHETDRSEALRLICSAAFAHNKTNVVSAPMASFLLRNKSRFYCSHTFAFCPLRDVMRIHKKQDVTAQLKFTSSGHSFFENQALHYLCRHKSTEHISLMDFFSIYEVKNAPNKDPTDDETNPVLRFQNETPFFKHPSVMELYDPQLKRKVMKCTQGVKEREKRMLVKVSQWGFPDTDSFKGHNILECHPDHFNEAMEQYAEMVLTLFKPHRSNKDLISHIPNVRWPHVFRLRTEYQQDVLRQNNGGNLLIFCTRNLELLQRIQNSARNSLRYRVKEDDLQGCTVPFELDDDLNDEERDSYQQEEEDEDEDVTGYDAFMDQLQGEQPIPLHDTDPELMNEALHCLSFKEIRSAGHWNCGFGHDIQTPVVGRDIPMYNNFLSRDNLPVHGQGDSDFAPIPGKDDQRQEYSVKTIVQILLKRTTARKQNVWKDKDIQVPGANGSISSIREWAVKALGNDRKQQRAFECIIASFLLTFYNQQEGSDAFQTESIMDRSKYRRSRRDLLRLMGRKPDGDPQLIGLLHGPGGCGKSTVINLVKAYARSYCEAIGHPFSKRTIVITAMSGVAATLLNGETTHQVIGLNRKDITETEKDNFKDARLLVIDEISFAGEDVFGKQHRHIQALMRERFIKYGGLNILFAGDYSQLEPVKKTAIYDLPDPVPEFHDMLNCFIELDGTHRFKDDPEWGQMLRRFREGHPTVQDIHDINESCDVNSKQPPVGIQVATHMNRDRDAVNSALFDEYCKRNGPADGSVFEGAVLVLMDDLRMKQGKEFVQIKSNSLKRFFYENCSEDDCSGGKSKKKTTPEGKSQAERKSRIDPMLKLYPNCPMMYTKNSDVANGEANGSRVHVTCVNPKIGEAPFHLKLDNGTTIRAFYASQVDCIVVQHENEDISPSTFEIKPAQATFMCSMDVADENHLTSMKGQQFQIISNTCTTGHKLQGCTVESILVNDWFYRNNWAYVVLSRVKTMAGLYMRQPLSTDLSKYSMKESMLDMIDSFRIHALAQLTDTDYLEMIQQEQA